MDRLEATTTRPVTFGASAHGSTVRHSRTYPAGTYVYATERRDGSFTARVAGTLYDQIVYANAITPA